MKNLIPLLLMPALLACILTPVTTATTAQIHERYRRATLAVQIQHIRTVDGAKGLEWRP